MALPLVFGNGTTFLIYSIILLLEYEFCLGKMVYDIFDALFLSVVVNLGVS